mgnify:CR=1 FL=1
MKQTLKRRICAAILCHILLLGLAGCGKANKAKPNDGGDPPVKASVDALKQGQPAADSEETVDGAESLARVRGDLEYDGRLTGAAAYLGLREKGDQTELTDWLRENCADLTSELPFLLEIPSERVLGAGYGKLFCIVPRDEMQRIGGVGQAARASGLARDIRTSHPWGVFAGALRHESIVKTHGDVMARLMVRCREVLQSAGYIDRLLDLHGQECGNAGHPRPDYAAPLAPSSLAFGLVEGWRGETCHVLLTDAEGRIAAVRIKDPSLHNWLALALAVRGEGISDFPICNKSFNLSYCGHDL